MQREDLSHEVEHQKQREGKTARKSVSSPFHYCVLTVSGTCFPTLPRIPTHPEKDAFNPYGISEGTKSCEEMRKDEEENYCSLRPVLQFSTKATSIKTLFERWSL